MAEPKFKTAKAKEPSFNFGANKKPRKSSGQRTGKDGRVYGS